MEVFQNHDKTTLPLHITITLIPLRSHHPTSKQQLCGHNHINSLMLTPFGKHATTMCAQSY